MARTYTLIALSLLFSPLALATSGPRGAATLSAGPTSDRHRTETIESEPIDWTPVVNPMPVPNAQEAGNHLDFPPPTPRGLGQPDQVLVTHPDSALRTDRIISLEYTHPDFGHFLVLQSVSQTNEAELSNIAARCLPETGCEAKASVEVLGQNNIALLLEGPTTTSIIWIRGRVRFDVVGPADSFTAEDARGVANQF